jgi:hypothetical protein
VLSIWQLGGALSMSGIWLAAGDNPLLLIKLSMQEILNENNQLLAPH